LLPVRSTTARPSAIERWLLRRALDALGNPPITLELWTGEEFWHPPGESRGRLRLVDPAMLRGLAHRTPSVALGEAYASGQLEIEGDLVQILEAGVRAGYHSPLWARFLSRARSLRWPSNTVARSRRSARHHYDLGNDFYRLWLDEQMVYSCAYFEGPETDLEEAQIAKLDHVCRKLDLQPGERVVEAGCGWGALALHMAERYGVSVQAFNHSIEQVRWARERATRRGLGDRVEFVLDDYRSIRGTYDAFVSIGMLEHVGLAQYHDLGSLIRTCLRPGGRGLLHFIGRSEPTPTNTWFERRIFPGAELPALSQALATLESSALVPVDIENLRRHYIRTLEHWLERFEKSSTRIEAEQGPQFARSWRLYLSGSIAAFRAGSCQLYQLLFIPRGEDSLPWTRAYQYEQGRRDTLQRGPASLGNP
jgi:cyclopropane-fatty-acyl-phospholipid synthase